MLEKMFSIFRPKAPAALTMVLEHFGGGVRKRVDENRELLELLHAKAPKLLEDCPWNVGWIQSNDEFFTALESLSVPLGASNQQFTKWPGFPRLWSELFAKQTTSSK